MKDISSKKPARIWEAWVPALRVLLVAAVAFTPVVHAQETVLWRQPNVMGWIIGVDKTVGDGCFIVSEFAGGTTLRVGFNRTNSSAYMMLLNKSWRSIRNQSTYEIVIQFDRESPWEASATGLTMNSLPGFVASTTKPDFIYEFVRKHGVLVSYTGKEIARLSLKGTAAATAEMLKCQEEMDNGKSKQASDPFEAGPSSEGSDPFEQ